MPRKLLTLLSLIAALALAAPLAAQSIPYCNITAVDAQQLSNGVQITVKADGVLQLTNDYSGSMSGNRLALTFPNAKSSVGKSFIDVSKFPVSYVQFSVPQTAKEGVGIEMAVAMYEPSNSNVRMSDDRQSVIITINSSRTLVSRPGNGGGEATKATPSGLEIVAHDGLLTVNAVKASLRTLLAQFARKSGVNIAVDDSVKDREVSLTFDGLPVDQALKAVAGASGLAISTHDGVTMISDGVPVDLATYHLSSTESFRMKNIKAQVASGLLPTFLYSFLHVNDAQNAVVVTAPAPMLDKIRADFEKIDVAPPQIMIEALAVEVANTSDLQADLGLAYRDGDNAAVVTPKTGDISYSTIGALPSAFEARLKALVTNGKAKVRATPRMAAVNGRNADIFIGETKFIKVEVSSYGGKQERIQGVDVGVKLAVRPWTGGNGEITVTLEPEVSNISEIERETGLPVLSTRRAQTTVRVKDGETIMIGGLVQQQDYATKTKVPILGDLPWVGRVFQSTKTNSLSTELVIFVTPHILTDRGRLKNEKAEETTRNRFK